MRTCTALSVQTYISNMELLQMRKKNAFATALFVLFLKKLLQMKKAHKIGQKIVQQNKGYSNLFLKNEIFNFKKRLNYFKLK
jgi:hypothetical protein